MPIHQAEPALLCWRRAQRLCAIRTGPYLFRGLPFVLDPDFCPLQGTPSNRSKLFYSQHWLMLANEIPKTGQIRFLQIYKLRNPTSALGTEPAPLRSLQAKTRDLIARVWNVFNFHSVPQCVRSLRYPILERTATPRIARQQASIEAIGVLVAGLCTKTCIAVRAELTATSSVQQWNYLIWYSLSTRRTVVEQCGTALALRDITKGVRKRK
jgi:hypothetical protein